MNTEKPTPESVLRRMMRGREDTPPEQYLLSDVTYGEAREVLGIKPPGPFPASYHGHFTGFYVEAYEKAGYSPKHLEFIGFDARPMLARPEALRLWADLGEWLFGPLPADGLVSPNGCMLKEGFVAKSGGGCFSIGTESDRWSANRGEAGRFAATIGRLVADKEATK